MKVPDTNQGNTRNSLTQEGAWLAAFRSRVIGLFEESGLTQQAFAKKLGRKQGTVQRWIDRHGKTVPDAGGIVRLVEYFGVSAQWLLTGTGDRDTKPATGTTDPHVVRRQVAREMRALVQQAVDRALAEYIEPTRSGEDDAAAKTAAAWKADRRAQPRPGDPPAARHRSG